jgi:hypothetical protein
MMAVFTIGADDIRIRHMQDIAEAWGFAGKYSDVIGLLKDAKRKKFDSVLVVDTEALEEEVKIELKNLDIEIISLKDKKILEKRIL